MSESERKANERIRLNAHTCFISKRFLSAWEEFHERFRDEILCLGLFLCLVVLLGRG